MKKKIEDEDDMLPEYDLRGGVRGKYAARYAEGTNVVLLDPDVHEAFPDSKSVNDTLRMVIKLKAVGSGGEKHKAQGANGRRRKKTG